MPTLEGVTQRKPPTVTWPGWIEQQVRRAEAEGAFENLPGAGRPIRGLDRPHDDLAWVAEYLRREDVDVAEVLPPALQLAKEVETLDERLAGVRSSAVAHAMIDDLNQRIDEAYARPQTGPPLRVKKVRVDETLARWRAARTAAEPAPAPPAPTANNRRRRWWRPGRA
jgi:hypothetical protein